MKIKLAVFGCKVNQYEAQVLRENLLGAGHQLVDGLHEADRVIVNTCVVTGRAESEGLRLARRAAAAGKDVVVTGCFSRTNSGGCEAGENCSSFPRIAGQASPPRRVSGNPDLISLPPGGGGEVGGIQSLCFDSLLSQFSSPRNSITYFAGHSRAFLKVEDGCDRKCAYCIVSRIRGPIKSRPIGGVLTEVQALVKNNYRDIVLSGINLGCYGQEINTNLVELIKAIVFLPDLPKNFRVRLSSLEPDLLNRELLDLMSSGKQIFPHLHLPLQSGSDCILAAMGRRYTSAEYFALVSQARKQIPGLVLSTDLMVGFPGETEADFQQTANLAQKIAFDRTHIFRFSPRPGTPAADFPDQVPEKIKRDRSRRLKETCANKNV